MPAYSRKIARIENLCEKIQKYRNIDKFKPENVMFHFSGMISSIICVLETELEICQRVEARKPRQIPIVFGYEDEKYV